MTSESCDADGQAFPEPNVRAGVQRLNDGCSDMDGIGRHLMGTES